MNDEDKTKAKCSGFDFRKPNFGDEGRKLFFGIVGITRDKFEFLFSQGVNSLPKYDPDKFCKCGRFNNNDDILGRVQSATVEMVFLANPTLWILAGLLDAGEDQYVLNCEEDKRSDGEN